MFELFHLLFPQFPPGKLARINALFSACSTDKSLTDHDYDRKQPQPAIDWKDSMSPYGDDSPYNVDNAVQQQQTPSNDDDSSSLVAEPLAPSISSNLYAALLNSRRRPAPGTRSVTLPEKTSEVPSVFGSGGMFQPKNGVASVEPLDISAIKPTSRTRVSGFVDGDEPGHERFKRCFTCGGMGGGGMGGGGMGGGGMGGGANQNFVDAGQQQSFNTGNAEKLLEIGSILNGGGLDSFGGSQSSFGSSGSGQQQVIIRQGGDQGGFLIGSGTQTIAGELFLCENAISFAPVYIFTSQHDNIRPIFPILSRYVESLFTVTR